MFCRMFCMWNKECYRKYGWDYWRILLGLGFVELCFCNGFDL